MTTDTEIRHPTATLILSCLAQFMVILDVSVVNVALPSIHTALKFTEVDLQWVVNAYTVTFAGFLLLGGRAADLLGRRRTFVFGLVLFAASSLAGGLAQSQAMLIGARAAQGLGGAVIAPASLSIITTSFTEASARNRAVGIWGAMGGAGGAVGVLLGGVITSAINWRWILFINVPIGLGGAFLTQRLVAEGRNAAATKSFDLAGAITATAGLSLLVLGIVRTDAVGWGSAQGLGLMGGGLALIGVFLTIEGKAAQAPLMPLRIYKNRTLSSANIVVLSVGAATFGMWFFLTLYLQQVLGYSPLRAGLAFLPMALLIAAGAQIASRVMIRTGPKPLLIAGMVMQAVGLLMFTSLSPHGSYVGDVLPGSLLIALGIGFAFVTGTICAVQGVAPTEAGLASGLVNTARMVGGALGLAVLAAVATHRTTHELRFAHASLRSALTSGFQLAFTLGAAIAMAGALVALVGLPANPARARARAQKMRPEPVAID